MTPFMERRCTCALRSRFSLELLDILAVARFALRKRERSENASGDEGASE